MVKHLNLIVIGILILGVFVALPIKDNGSLIVGSQSNQLIVYSPVANSHIPLLNPKELRLNITIYAPTAPPGSTVLVHIKGPYGITMTSAGIPVGDLDANHMFSAPDYVFPASLFQVNGTRLATFLPGQYNVTIAVAGFSTTIPIYVVNPNQIGIIVYVYNNNGASLSGVTVSVYNATNGQLLVTNETNAQGMVALVVPYVHTMTNVYNVTAVKPGYQLVYKVVTIPPNYTGTVVVKLTTTPVTFTLTPVCFQVGGVQQPAQPQQLPGAPQPVYVTTVFMNVPLSIIINASHSGKPVDGATITACYKVNGKQFTATAKGLGNGQYNLSIPIPASTVPYTLQITVTGKYQSNVYTFIVLANVLPNYLAMIDQMRTEIAQLNSTISTLVSQMDILRNNITYLNNMISTLKQQIANLNTTLTNLRTQLTTVNSTLVNEINNLQGKVNNLNNELNKMQTQLNNNQNQLNNISSLVYGGLILGIIALIIAIVAIVLVFRKVA